MAMSKGGHRPGGGLHSKNVYHRTEPKREPRAYGRSPGAVGQYGASQGNHVTSTVNTNYRGDPDVRSQGYNAPVGPSNLALSGPGAGRTLHGQAGSQGQHGAPVQGQSRPSTRG